MSEHRMAAVFYVRRDAGPPPSLEELMRRAGVTEILRDRDDDAVRLGRWGVMESVRAERQLLDGHVCLLLFPHLSDLLDRLGGDASGAAPIADAFRAACDALHPDAAMLYTRPDEVEPTYLAAQYPKVLGIDGILLDESSPVLLYLSSEFADGFPEAYRAGRDRLPVSNGLLLFRGAGARRWW